MQNKLIALATLLAAAVSLWAGYTSIDGRSDAQSLATQAVEVTLGQVESVVTAQGKLEPKDYVDVGAQVSGLVQKLNVEIGDEVKQGALIAEIDPDVYAAQVRGDEARLKTLQAQQAQQQALIQQARQKFNRNQKLFKHKAVSTEALQDAETDLAVAKAQLQSIAAQIEEEQSTLAGHKANLSYTKIYAPMTGTVVEQSVKEGQTINSNQTAPTIVQVANLDVMTAKAQVAEADIMKLKVGMPMYFTTLGADSRRWEGTVRQILPAPETVNDVVLYNVLVDVKNTGHLLMTGMTTQMFFVLGRANNVPVIPPAALLERLPKQDTAQGKAYRVEVLEHGRATPKTVLVSLTNRTQAAVIEGLQAGQYVLLGGAAGAARKATAERMRMPRL